MKDSIHIEDSQTGQLENAPLTRNRFTSVAWLIIIALPFVHMITLSLMGRVWWCKLGDWNPISLDAWGPHNSQHIFDPYTFSHILHGVFFFFFFNWGPMKKSPAWGLLICALLEAGWEILENSPIIIDRYRAATAAVGYLGDSVMNSTADIIFCMLGWWIARAIGLFKSILFFLVLELGCLWWIRDNLTLNVIMLIRPIEAIRNWQSGN